MRPTILNSFFEPASNLNGVGPKVQKILDAWLSSDKNGQARYFDILTHLPSGVIDRGDQPLIAHVTAGRIVTIRAHIIAHYPPPRGRRNVPYRVKIRDDSGEMSLVFFHAHEAWLKKQLPIDELRMVSGKVDFFHSKPNMVHPDLIATEAEFSQLPKLEPVYPLTKGISQKLLTKIIGQILEKLPNLDDWQVGQTLLPVGNHEWPNFSAAIKALHRPQNPSVLEPTSAPRCRLAYDELLAGQLALALFRHSLRATSGIPRQFQGNLSEALVKALPYSLTTSQAHALQDIRADLKSTSRMLRLLHGDVGAGKTVVALLAMADCVESGAQAALMAPTEILAVQHFQSLHPLCDAVGIQLRLITGSDNAAARKETLSALADGQCQIVIGTHALFQKKVEFKNLGLAIIDEQHRFGVHQRLTLGDKNSNTDMLVMTATPIPRTLVLTHFGDMEVSQLTEKPKGRKPIITTLLSLKKLDQLLERVSNALQQGHKIYWICPLVEDSELLPMTSAQARFEHLSKRFGNSVGLVHGRMQSTEKSEAMDKFQHGEKQLLVATTAIEVGVDVPDANIIIIERAERFGLAQLHQLRGRVGRGALQSYCTLLFEEPLGETARARLECMRDSNDGFYIAEQDLKLRGEGDLLGTRQSGEKVGRFSDASAHAQLLKLANHDARQIVDTDPDLVGERGQKLRNLLYLFGQDQAIRLLRSG